MDVGHQKREEFNMARYTGPRLRLSRREGTDLMLTSGTRAIESNVNLIISLEMQCLEEGYQIMVHN